MFAAGFLLGTVRVVWIVPRVGMRTAELMEMPVMALVSFVAARFTARRLAMPFAVIERLRMGLGALGCLVLMELAVVLWVQGSTLRDSVAGRDPVSGAAYLAGLGLFAAMPLLVART